MSRLSDALVIGIGIAVMVVALIRAIGFESMSVTVRSRLAWKILIALMIFFIAGYVAALVLVLRSHLQYLSAVTSVIFSVGAIFVLFTVDFALINMKTVLGFSHSLELQTFQLKEQTRELEDTNRALAAQMLERQRIDDALEKANKELLFARDAALDASLAKSQFLMTMSHELRTPLNAILGYGDMLREEIAEQKQLEFLPDLDRIQLAARRLLSMIDDILDISRIEAGKMELQLQSFDLASVIRETAVRSLVDARKNGNAVEIKLKEGMGIAVSDLGKFRQVLYNLLSNAVKFTENGTITLEAAREKVEGQDWITLQVSDTGIGIAGEQIQMLFQPFRQADNSPSRKYGGTGLGLAITKHFCRMMGGTISVESEPQKGSVFTVWLPVEIHDPALERV